MIDLARESLRKLLKSLLERLEAIGQSHEDLYDTETREAMSQAIMRGFVEAQAGFQAPLTYGLHSASANADVRTALLAYMSAASAIATDAALDEPARLAAFQDPEVHTDGDRQFFDDFFGWVAPG